MGFFHFVGFSTRTPLLGNAHPQNCKIKETLNCINLVVFMDDGFTGNNPARPAFARLNTDIASGQVARVLARSVTRLGRNIADVLAWARAAQEQGVEVITLNDAADWNLLPALEGGLPNV